MKPSIRIDGGKRRDLDKDRIAGRMAGLPAHAPTAEQKIARLEAAAKRAKAEAKVAARPRQDIRHQTVENPYFSRAHPENKNGNVRRIGVAVNIRESAVATMAARGLLDRGQVQAADRFRELYEAVGGSGVGAMDYGHEPVDGGGARDALGEAQVAAGQALQVVRIKLGERNYELVCRVCGEGLALAEISAIRRDRDTAADNLKAALDDLSTMWGIAVRCGAGWDAKLKAAPDSAGLGKLRGERSFERGELIAGALVDTVWADAENQKRRERATKKTKQGSKSGKR